MAMSPEGRNNPVIIDVSAIAYKALFSLGSSRLTNDEKPVAIIFGFLMQILKISEKLRSNNLLFAFDSKKSYRKMAFAGYKDKRHSDMTQDQRLALNACQQQVIELYEDVLPAMGFTRLFKQTGLEADDHMASIVANNIDEWTMVTADEDMYQCLCDRVQILLSSKNLMYTKKDFIQEYGIEPEMWASVKAIGGCTSDTVPGISGVGTGKAIKYLRREMNQKSKTFQNIEAGAEDIAFYRTLVTLPHEKHRPIVLSEYPQPALRLIDFENTFHRYNFHSFLRTDAWKKWNDAFQFAA